MSDYQITITETGERFACSAEQNVLKAMEVLARKDIPIGCRGGGCGVCRVQVIASHGYRTKKMSRAQVSLQEEQDGVCLACKLYPDSDLELRVIGKMCSTVINEAVNT